MIICLLLLVVCCLWGHRQWHGMAVNKNPSPLSVGIDKGEGFLGVLLFVRLWYCGIVVLLFVETRAKARQSCVVKKFAATRQRKQ